MGLLAYYIHPDISKDENGDPDIVYIDNKFYFIIDGMDVNYPQAPERDERYPIQVDESLVNINITLNGYDKYEHRIKRTCLSFTFNFNLENVSRRSDFSDNIWTKCYNRAKDFLVEENTKNLKVSLELNETDSIPTQYEHLLVIEDDLN